MNGFALLWSKTLDSSVWRRESKDTRLVWVTMLMMKDSEGIVRSSKVGLADRARVTDAECEEALLVLVSPDKNDTSGVEDGRRVREIPGGWQIVNHEMYRFSTEAKREFWRTQKAEQRERSKAPLKKPRRTRKSSGSGPLPGESSHIRSEDNGASEAQLNAIATDSLPPTLQ